MIMGDTVRTVALLGGSFNPPHIGHSLVAHYVLETQEVDQLWLVPTYQHVFGKTLAPYAHRVAMCEAMAETMQATHGPRAQVSRSEEALAHAPGFVGSRTFDLLQLLIAESPGLRFRWVIGADILGETDKWHRWDDVIAMAPLIVVGRGGQAAPPAGAAPVEVTVSSTDVRQRLTDRQDVTGLLPRAVLRYIEREGLYR